MMPSHDNQLPHQAGPEAPLMDDIAPALHDRHVFSWVLRMVGSKVKDGFWRTGADLGLAHVLLFHRGEQLI